MIQQKKSREKLRLISAYLPCQLPYSQNVRLTINARSRLDIGAAQAVARMGP